MWKPFHARFGDLIQQMADHRKALFEELLLQTSNGIFKDRVNIAAMRELMSLEQAHDAAERQLAAEERRLAKEERLLMADKRQQDAQARQNIENSLTYLRAKMKALEHDRVGGSLYFFLSSSCSSS
jgi:DNA-binding transcriptional MerR regulator